MTALDDLADIGRSRVFDNLNEIAIIIHNQNTLWLSYNFPARRWYRSSRLR